MELMFRVCDVGSLPICSCLSENPSDRLISSGNPEHTSSESPSKWSSAVGGESSLSVIVLIVAQSTPLYKIYYKRCTCEATCACSVRPRWLPWGFKFHPGTREWLASVWLGAGESCQQGFRRL